MVVAEPVGWAVFGIYRFLGVVAPPGETFRPGVCTPGTVTVFPVY